MFDQLTSTPALAEVKKNMISRQFDVDIVKDKKEALKKLKSLLPKKSQVMVGSSQTLHQIGFMDYIGSADSPLQNLQAEVWGEQDEQKRNKLRRQATTADYFISSVNAVTQDGQLVAVDGSGSRVGAIPFSAGKVILVIGAQKITKDLDQAILRIRKHVFPLEDARAKEAYGMGSIFGKWLIVENEIVPHRIHIILVEEKLGF